MAKKRVWRHSNDFRRMAVERFNSCENIVALAKVLGIQRLLYKWREDFEVTDSIGEPLPSIEAGDRGEKTFSRFGTPF
jgi:transposase-like protein